MPSKKKVKSHILPDLNFVKKLHDTILMTLCANCGHRWKALIAGRSGHECCKAVRHRGPHQCWCEAKQKRKPLRQPA